MISTNMLSIINETSHPLLEYIKDDPVRPELSREFRVTDNRFVTALVETDPRAMLCVSLHNFVPTTVEELQQSSRDPSVAIFYTIWSYSPGAAVQLLRETVEYLRQTYPNIKRLVTLSPPTPMAKRFHLKNGAQVFRINETTVNYEYLDL
jgi:hypothetical protein